METRRRSARVKTKASDDESSTATASSHASRGSTTRSTGKSAVTGAAIKSEAEESSDKLSTPQRRTRSSSNASEGGSDTPVSSARRTRSRSSTVGSTPGDDTPNKRTRAKKSDDVSASGASGRDDTPRKPPSKKGNKRGAPKKLDVIHEIIEDANAAEQVDEAVKSPVKEEGSTPRKNPKTPEMQSVKMDEDAPEKGEESHPEETSTKSPKRSRKSKGNKNDPEINSSSSSVSASPKKDSAKEEDLADLASMSVTPKEKNSPIKESDVKMEELVESTGATPKERALNKKEKKRGPVPIPPSPKQATGKAKDLAVVTSPKSPKRSKESTDGSVKNDNKVNSSGDLAPMAFSPKKEDTSIKGSDEKKEKAIGAIPSEGSSKKKKKKRQRHLKKDDSTAQSAVTPPKVTPLPPVKHQPIFDMAVHRLRFLKVVPKSIIAMASSPFVNHAPTSQQQQQKTRKHQFLAISRQGGSVELIHPNERWITLGHVPGVRGREVDSLVWVCGSGAQDGSRVSPPRLVGASRDGTMFLLDFTSQRQTHVVGSGAGGVFCLTSLCHRGKCGCRSEEGCSGYFAAGCEDGTIKVYRVMNERFEFVSTLPSAGNAVLSVAWLGNKNNTDKGDVLGGSVIFAGVADGTIRRYDCVSSVVTTSISTGIVLSTSDSLGGRSSSTATVHRWKSSLRMTVENRGLREATKVWALQALSDGTVISGDSLGNVQFWDGMFGTMLQTLAQGESGADVLCLAISADENKVFASGVDSRVMCIQRQGLSSEDNVDVNPDSIPIRKWINVCAHRKHTHDVSALAVCHKKVTGSKKPMELLVSGGIDTRVCSYLTNEFRSSRPKIWFNWSSLSPISLSRDQRLISVTRNDKIDLFRLEASSEPGGKLRANEEKDESKCLVKTISIKSPFNLNCSTISNDGKFLAASDASALYLFSLNMEIGDGAVDIRPTKIHLPKGYGRPSTALRFDDTSRLICATIDGAINILQLSPSSSEESSYKVSLEHVFEEHWTVDSLFHNSAVVSLDVSFDGKWLAAARFSRGKGSVHVFSLETFESWWPIPEMEATSTCIKFLGGGALAVGCANNSFYIYNTQTKTLSDWSHDMGLPILKSLPKELSSRSEPLTRILSTPSLHQKLVLGAHGFFCVVDLDRPVPDKSDTFPLDSLRAKRSVSVDDDAEMYLSPPKIFKHTGNNNFTICLKFSNLLFQDFINEKEMVVVEEPWMSVLEELPEALARRVYGT